MPRCMIAIAAAPMRGESANDGKHDQSDLCSLGPSRGRLVGRVVPREHADQRDDARQAY